MEKRERDIINLLQTQGTWRTASQLAAELGCSVRSVKSAVANINEETPALIESGRRGFRLNTEVSLPDAVSVGSAAIPQNAESRRSYILRKLLMEEAQCDLDDLSAELCISPATLTNELGKLRPLLLDYDLGLRIRANTLSISGIDADKKRMVSWLIYTETKDFFNSMTLMNDYFPDINLAAVRNTVTASLTRHQYYLNDYSMSNLLLHVAITIERNLHGFYTDEEEPSNRAVLIPAHLQATVDEFCSGLEQQFSITLNSSDRYAFCVILYTRRVRRDSRPQAEMIEPSVRSLVLNITARVKDMFDIDLTDHDFTVRFGLHIKNMLIRFHGGIQLRNPQLEMIKSNYPYIYDIAVFIASEINTETGVHISEDEIAYIALHIGGLIEQLNSERSKLRAILLCPGYYNEGMVLMKHIYRTFQDSLLLEDMVSSPDALAEHTGCDLLLSTVPVQDTKGMSFLLISNYLNSRDIAAIAARIDELKRKRLHNKMESSLKSLFRPELFWYDPPFAGPADAITEMGGRLEALQYARPGFCQKLFDREAISSSAVGPIAIPHPLDMDAAVTAIAVAICPQEMSWGANRVNSIFMLAIRKEDRRLFRDLFDFVSDVVMQPKYAKALKAADTYDAFINTLLESL